MNPGVPRPLRRALSALLAIAAAAALASAAHAYDVRIEWTAPGDDSTFGRATEYDLRYHWKPRLPGDFLDTQRWLDVPVPGVAGTPEHCIVTNLDGGETWYFALRAKDERGNWSLISNVAVVVPTVGVDGAEVWPLAFSEAVPSPARAGTRFALSLPVAGRAEIEALDLAGRRVRSLLRAELPAGPHDVSWNLRDDHGERVAPGVYFVRAAVGGEEFRRRVVVVR